MRFRRKRKPRVVWLPPTGTIINSGLIPFQQYGGNFFIGNLPLGGNHNPTIEFPLVLDSPDPRGTIGTLAAYQAQALQDAQDIGYRLRRIVGKIHVGAGPDLTQPPGGTRSNFVACTAGIIVRRVDENANSVAGPDGISTQAVQNWPDPWIWRRTWLIGTGIFAASGNVHNCADLWPRNNVTGVGGGNSDAAHVDQKTARLVGPEERLFLDVSFISGLQLDGQDESEEFVNIMIHHDLRILGSLRQNAGNRRNASR